MVWRRLSTRGDAGLDVHAAGACALHTHSLESSPADSIAPNPASAFQYTCRQNPISERFSVGSVERSEPRTEPELRRQISGR